jgi:hypothetical protein
MCNNMHRTCEFVDHLQHVDCMSFVDHLQLATLQTFSSADTRRILSPSRATISQSRATIFSQGQQPLVAQSPSSPGGLVQVGCGAAFCFGGHATLQSFVGGSRHPSKLRAPAKKNFASKLNEDSILYDHTEGLNNCMSTCSLGASGGVGGDPYIRGSAPASYMFVLISRGLHFLMMAGLDRHKIIFV